MLQPVAPPRATEEPRLHVYDVLAELRMDLDYARDLRQARTECRWLRTRLSEALAENLLLRGMLNAWDPPEERID